MPVHRIYTAPSPFNESELRDLDFEQTADVVYYAHQNHPPTKLIRAGHTDWSYSQVTFGPTIAAPTGIGGSATVDNTDSANSGNAYFPQTATYVVTAYNEETGQESRASASVELTNDLALKRNFNEVTWSAVADATAYKVYKAENTQAYGHIGTTDELSFIDDNIGPDLSVGPPIGDNPFASAGDYPSTITFHEQRTCWGRTLNRPNAVWFSRSADYENMDFTRPAREDDAFPIGLVANKVNAVNQLVSFKQGLLALTGNNIFSIQGSNEDYITATPPPRVRPEISRGSSRLNPITIDNVVFYETAKTGEIRTIGYEFEADGVRTDDLTIFSRQFFENYNAIAWAWLEKPSSLIIVVRDDGSALALTWDQPQQVWGWTIWETPGGLFKDVCVVTEDDEDRAYFLVEREIDGQTVHYVERMGSELWQDQADACYLDSAATFFSDEQIATIDRLDHLEGEVVVAWVDGQAVARLNGEPIIVRNGSITLPISGNQITVGLAYEALIETLPLAAQTGAGWSVALPQQAGKVILKVVNTRNIEAGPDDAQLFEVKQRETEDYGNPIALYTGDLEVDMAPTSGSETVVVVRSADPTPMHIAAILIEPKFGDL